MHKLLGVFVCLSALLYSAVSFAYTVEVREHIPETYMLAFVNDVDPDKPIDEKEMEALLDSVSPSKFMQVQLAIYDKGKSFGDGMRALLEQYKGGGKRLIESKPKSPLSEEDYVGYTAVTPFMILDVMEYSPVDKRLYTNATFLLIMNITGIGQNASGVPYIEEKVDGRTNNIIGVDVDASAKVLLRKKDPFLRQIKVGDDVIVRVRVTDVVHEDVTLEGNIVRFYEEYFSD